MPKRVQIKPPTDEEIMQYSNVPYTLAAKYIGWSDLTVRYALQQGRAPFGVAVQNHSTGTWSYNISPGLLIKYKSGDIPAYRLKEVLELAAYGFGEVIGPKLDGIEQRLRELEATS